MYRIRRTFRVPQFVRSTGDKSAPVPGVPVVDYGGQGGLGDVVLHPDFSNNHLIYLSFAESGEGDTRGAAGARGELILNSEGGGEIAGTQ